MTGGNLNQALIARQEPASDLNYFESPQAGL